MADLSVQLAPSNPRGLLLCNPVMTASGTFGYGTEYGELFDVKRLGAIVCKGTTLKPRDGNPQPRLMETPSGVVNSIGLENIGVEAVVKEKAPIWARWGKDRVRAIVNIAGETINEYATIARRLEGVQGVSGIEVNVSCPNIACGGMEFGTDPKVAARVIAVVKKVSSLPLIAKLSPNVTDIAAIALAVVRAGADAITLINTVRAMAVNLDQRKSPPVMLVGGLSGPAIKPIALYMVHKVALAVDVPVIGCGGICSADDALEFLAAGATAVQVGTANFGNPRAALEVLEGIERFMETEKISDLKALARRLKAVNST